MLIKILFVIYFKQFVILFKVIKLSVIEFVILLAVALALLFKLYKAFGTESRESSVKIIVKPVDKSAEKHILENLSQIMEKQNQKVEIVNLNAADDKSASEKEELNSEIFLNGAKRVFEMVLLAFNKGDLNPVRELMSKKVYDGFNKVIESRKSEEITSEVDFICFEKSEIKDIRHLKNTIKVVVEFVSEQINLLKDKNGKVIEGDENFVQKITDMWTFERPLDAKNNIWTLVSTKKHA